MLIYTSHQRSVLVQIFFKPNSQIKVFIESIDLMEILMKHWKLHSICSLLRLWLVFVLIKHPWLSG